MDGSLRPIAMDAVEGTMLPRVMGTPERALARWLLSTQQT